MGSHDDIVSQKCANFFLSELRQISTNVDSFFGTDMAKTIELRKVHSLMLLGGPVVRALDSGPRGREFDSRRLRFRVTRSTQPSILPG